MNKKIMMAGILIIVFGLGFLTSNILWHITTDKLIDVYQGIIFKCVGKRIEDQTTYCHKLFNTTEIYCSCSYPINNQQQ